MADVSNKHLVKTADGIAPQYYNPATGQFETLQGRDGALYFVDSYRKKEHFGYSHQAKPIENVEKGDTYFEFDTGDIYIFDGVIWVVM